MSVPTVPVVVKLGGSLFDRTAAVVKAVRESGRPALIVPGGGRFADLVRRRDLPDTAAHWMALAAMEQFGWYIASHGVPATAEIARPRETTLLLPYCPVRRADPLPHSWDITSDTIAAWVASELQVDLILLKSVDGIRRHRTLLARVDRPVPTGAVDPALIPFVLEHGVRTTVINGRIGERIARALRGLPVTGTVIDTRF